MSYEFDAPETVDIEGSRCSEPGTYHMVVSEIYDGLMPDGQSVLTGGGFSVLLAILDGTVKGQQDKTVGLMFGHPKIDATPAAKNMAAAKKAALFIATDLLTPEQLGKRVSIDLAAAKGRQIVASLDRDSREGKEKFLQMSYAHVHHVDDPRVAGIPKSAEALALIPKGLRHDAKYFETLQKKSSSASGVGGATAEGGRPKLTAQQLADL